MEGRWPDNTELLFIEGKAINPEIAHDADALIVRTRTKCDASLLDGSKVKLVATATIGTDHIDSEWCKANNIKVTSAPGCNAPGVAQYVLASLLRSGFVPQKDVLGIVGYGHVGSLVAKWAEKLGIEILVNDAPKMEEGNKEINYTDIDTLFEKSDAVTLHVPLTQEGKYATKNLIGERELKKMKPGAWLVNSSRGGVVDEKSLKKEISEKGIKAIVDVWENEPAIDLELLDLLKIGTPHIAGYSAEGKKRATGMVLDSIRENLGISVNTEDLLVPYPSIKDITLNLLIDSYNPFEDSTNLKKNPGLFEELRNKYNYRHEPGMI